MKRRTFLATGLAALVYRTRGFGASSTSIAEAFDREIEAFMKARDVPGGALAVVKDGRLVYVRGYGLADRERNHAVQPDSLFRIASISKPITSAAVLRLVEEKKLDLDQRAFDIVRAEPLLNDGSPPDARLAQITIRHLLHHTGGWDRDKSFDPMFRSRQIARAANEPSPARPEAVIRYMLGRPLEADPGSRYAYSNFGYCVLGRVIEKLTGETYEAHVRGKILAPLGITRMRLGATLDGQQVPGEVRYYTRGNSTSNSVFPDGGKVPVPYGGFFLESMDAHGGWIASAIDLVRFAAAFNDPAHCPIMRPETIALLHEPPAPPVSRKADGSLASKYYACGWSARPTGDEGKASYWHDGSLPGTATLLLRRWDGLSWAVLFNQRSEDRALPDGAIDGALHRAAEAVSEWPTHDLFPQYYPRS
jgi:N-acyl-D-amino-acid deacylase